jgi:hypothetical protein
MPQPPATGSYAPEKPIVKRSPIDPADHEAISLFEEHSGRIEDCDDLDVVPGFSQRTGLS